MKKVTPCHYKKLVIPHTIFSTKVLVSIENRDILVKKICPDFVYYDYLIVPYSFTTMVKMSSRMAEWSSFSTCKLI